MWVIKMSEQKRLEVGTSILFMDEVRVLRPALITAIHGTPAYDESGKLIWMPCVNIVTVSTDLDKKDAHGIQIERRSSVSHRSANAYHEQVNGSPVGMTWQFVDDVFA